MLSIHTEFLTDRMQRVVLDSVASEQIPIISGVHATGKCVGSSSVYPIYQRLV